MKAKYTYQATVKPRAAKQSANIVVTALSADTSSNQTVVKLNIEEEQKLVHLCYIKIGSPPPEDWRGEGGAISRIIAALEMTANERRNVERVIHKLTIVCAMARFTTKAGHRNKMKRQLLMAVTSNSLLQITERLGSATVRQ